MRGATYLNTANRDWRGRSVSRLTLCVALAAALAVPASARFQTQANEIHSPARAEFCNVATPVWAEFATLAPEATLEDHEGAVLFAIGQLACDNDAIIAGLEEMLIGDNLTKLQRQAVENVLASLRAGGGRGSGAIGSRGNSFFTAPVVSGGGGSSNYSS